MKDKRLQQGQGGCLAGEGSQGGGLNTGEPSLCGMQG